MSRGGLVLYADAGSSAIAIPLIAAQLKLRDRNAQAILGFANFASPTIATSFLVRELHWPPSEFLDDFRTPAVHGWGLSLL